MRTKEHQLRQDAITILRAAITAVDAGNAVRNHLACGTTHLQAGNFEFPFSSFDRIFLVSVGKAAVPMAHAVEAVLGTRLAGGIAVTKHGHANMILQSVRVLEAGHPVPDEAGLDASKVIIELTSGLTPRDLLIVAVSGGASALLPAPRPPVTLAAKQATTDLLLGSGAPIEDINTVRKHLSALKGGLLASLAHPCTVVALMVSDVVGDTHDVIGSGLTSPDPATFADALAVLERYGLTSKVPALVRLFLESGSRGEVPETPKPGDPVFRRVHNLVIASNQQALAAAFKEAAARGYQPHLLSSTVQGETREVARTQAVLLREVVRSGHPVPPPACVISGGETTVTLRGRGKGGRNMEFVLAAAVEIDGLRNALVLSAGTDGTDGPTDAAGAIATGGTLQRARAIGQDASDYLERNDSYSFFERLDDLIKTGPTGTNVMDIHLLMAR